VFYLISANKSLSGCIGGLLLADIFVYKMKRLVIGMNNDSLVRYNLQLSYLAKLKERTLITEEEYKKILEVLKRDYKVVSDVFS